MIGWDGCKKVLVSVDGNTQQLAWPSAAGAGQQTLTTRVLSDAAGIFALPDDRCNAVCGNGTDAIGQGQNEGSVVVGQGLCPTTPGSSQPSQFWPGYLGRVCSLFSLLRCF